MTVLTSASLIRGRRQLNALLRTRLVSTVCAPRDVDDYLELLDPAWSVRDVRARVVAVQPEAGRATSLWLQPNENWRGFRAGQYVNLSACVDGVRLTRCFSISSSPDDGLPLRVTIKALHGGRVGTWAARIARAGDVVRLSQALGEFTLPEPLPARLLFIGGGSGITPIAAMLRHLVAAKYGGEMACLHYAPDAPVLGAELTALASRRSRFRYVPILTRRAVSGTSDFGGHLSPEHLAGVAPQWRECETFVCGPPALRAAATQLVRDRGFGHHLHVERFEGAERLSAAGAPVRCRLTFARSGREIAGNPRASLLDQAEGAGLRPAHGCRMGICHSCKLRKLSGVVHNELTGALSTEPDDEIQLCVSTPRTDVVLDL